MSGCSSDGPCPNCGKNMDIYSDYKPFENINGQCYECGFYYKTVSGQLSLKELNGVRQEHNEYGEELMENLEKLPPIDKDLIWE